MNDGTEDKKGSQKLLFVWPIWASVLQCIFVWFLYHVEIKVKKKLETLGVILNCYFLPHVQVYLFSSINWFCIWSFPREYLIKPWIFFFFNEAIKTQEGEHGGDEAFTAREY